MALRKYAVAITPVRDAQGNIKFTNPKSVPAANINKKIGIYAGQVVNKYGEIDAFVYYADGANDKEHAINIAIACGSEYRAIVANNVNGLVFSKV